MLDRVYTIFDKRRRPLRNHVYLAFPEHDIAFARIAEAAFHTLAPVLHHLAGTEFCGTFTDRSAKATEISDRSLFHGNVELLTARELKRRHPDMKIVAWVQDPLHRLAYCYEKIIMNELPLPSYYQESYFDKSMSPEDFVSHVASISDLEADNLFRSQTAALTYKGALTADIILLLEHFEQSLDTFLAAGSLKFRPSPSFTYRALDYVSPGTLRSFEDEGLFHKLRRRYKADYELFYAQAAVLA
ncbi:sulfotransferase family 2 domain-containing protein [Roseibium marinum]|nr:sulfotransferase family 2 domain-containing protein [Roseibium marinum]